VGWLKVVIGAIVDWARSPNGRVWGRAAVEVIAERIASRRDEQAIDAAIAAARVADEDPATGAGPSVSSFPAAEALSLESAEHALLARIRVLTARMPVLADKRNAMARMLDLVKQLELVQDRLAAKARG
jgi:hypothetical protein